MTDYIHDEWCASREGPEAPGPCNCYVAVIRRREARIEELEAADETAWGIIANAKDWNVPDDGSPCGNMAKKWREAAIGWRDERHKRLAALAAEEAER